MPRKKFEGAAQGELILKGEPLELAKHVAAIQITNSITLQQRKIANALHLHAYKELADPSVTFHEITFQRLAELTGFKDSHNYKYVQDNVRALKKIDLEWNLMNVDGEHEWGITSYLADVRIVKGKGIIRYEYPSTMRKFLYNAKVFALLDLRFQNVLTGRYSLALYENCWFYLDQGRTPEWTPEILKKLLGVGVGENAEDKGTYDEYRYFKRLIVGYKGTKGLIEEINAKTNINVSFHEIRDSTRGRPVRAVWFGIEMKSQYLLPLPAPLHNQELLKRLMDDFEQTEAQAIEWLEKYPEDRTIKALDYVQNLIVEKGQKIDHPGRYALGMLEKGFGLAKESSLKNKRKQENLDALKNAQRMPADFQPVPIEQDKITEYLNSLSDSDQESLIESFGLFIRSNKPIHKLFVASGHTHPGVWAEFKRFVANEVGIA
jgi:hypothetical protein